ncbi:MAG: anthranilate phosphoribosyltransferase [Gammaproteobacteria bacterium]|nr:MAG: anthranilate phosphoribosyltransferase [Gammaproteobacteria bacterium]
MNDAMKQAIARTVEGEDLSAGEMEAAMRAIMGGEATPAQIGGLLVALRMKGETVTEVVAAARVMRELVTPVPLPREHLVDIVGTGGDASGTFNVSTASALVAAAAGARVAKHGNRSVSSRSGSADLLEAAGVVLDLDPGQVARCVEEVGIGFMFAPGHHPAMRHAVAPRRELGIRTLFNLLGPMTNPASAPNLLLGVFGERWLRPLAEALRELGARHVMVVHSADGLDEISIAAPTAVAELCAGTVEEYTITPEDFGLRRAPIDPLRVEGPEQSLALIRGILAGEPGPARDIVLLNAGAAIHCAGVAPSMADGVRLAATAIDGGGAARCLERLIETTRRLASES